MNWGMANDNCAGWQIVVWSTPPTGDLYKKSVDLNIAIVIFFAVRFALFALLSGKRSPRQSHHQSGANKGLIVCISLRYHQRKRQQEPFILLKLPYLHSRSEERRVGK